VRGDGIGNEMTDRQTDGVSPGALIPMDKAGNGKAKAVSMAMANDPMQRKRKYNN
jgi:hypothetical protein